jgi:hypothetical protein
MEKQIYGMYYQRNQAEHTIAMVIKYLSHHKAIFETAIHVFEIENTAFVF